MSELSSDQKQEDYTQDEFPHIRDKIQQLVASKTHDKKKEQYGEQVSDFRKRFPWQAFSKLQKDVDNQSKYTYMGRDTEKSEPFYISFDVKNTGVNKKDKQMLLEQMESMIAASMKADKQQWNGLAEQTRDKIQAECQNEDVIGRAYLLVGLAKPSITINQIYDTLFYQIENEAKNKPGKQPSHNNSEIQDSNSEMDSIDSQVQFQQNGSILTAYKHIRKSWQLKRKSYEFHKLMCRAYLHYEKYLKESQQKKGKLQEMSAAQQKIWLKKMIGDELFSQIRGRRVYLRNITTMQDCTIQDQEYYHYFMTLFQNHARQILVQINNFQKKNNSETNTLQIKLQNSVINSIKLQKYDYRSFAINLCKGVSLSEESLSNMVEYHRSNHNAMLNKIEFKTKQQRLKHIAKLEDCSNDLFRIKLAPLVQLQFDKSTKQTYTSIDNYLIVFQRTQRIFSTKVSKQFSLEKMINQQNNSSHPIQSKFMNEHLFQYIYCFKQISSSSQQKASLIENFSFNPKNIVLQYKKNDMRSMQKYPKFEIALEKYLGIDILPMSYEQQMLRMTPNEEIDLHEYIQTLYHDIMKIYQYKQMAHTIQDLSQLCESLSSSQIRFTLDEQNVSKQVIQMEKKVLDENRMKNYNTLMDRAREQKREGNFVFVSAMQDELSNSLFSDEKSKELVQLILKSINNTELVKLLMTSLFCYQFNKKDKHIFYKPQKEEDYLQQGRETYKVWNQHDQQKMYQYAMILLCSTRVIDSIRFTFKVNKDEPEKYKAHREQHKKILRAITMGYLSTLIQYFYYLLRIVSAQPHQRHSLIKLQFNREEGALESLFKLYDQLMSECSNNEDRALLKAGMINNLQKEKLQLVNKLINTQKYLKYMENYSKNVNEDGISMTFAQVDYDEKNFLTLYEEIQKKYLKINELYFNNNLRKNQEVKLDFKDLIRDRQLPQKLKAYLQIVEYKTKNLEEFFKNSRTNQRSLEDIKNAYVKLIKYKLQAKQKNQKQMDGKTELELELLNKLAEFALYNKKQQIKSKKQQLDPMIDQQCREIEEVQIMLFNFIYASYYKSGNYKLRIPTDGEIQQMNQMKLKLLMFFLYCEPQFNKNYIERLYSKATATQNNYELIRTMSLMIKCNIEVQERHHKIEQK